MIDLLSRFLKPSNRHFTNDFLRHDKLASLRIFSAETQLNIKHTSSCQNENMQFSANSSKHLDFWVLFIQLYILRDISLLILVIYKPPTSQYDCVTGCHHPLLHYLRADGSQHNLQCLKADSALADYRGHPGS